MLTKWTSKPWFWNRQPGDLRSHCCKQWWPMQGGCRLLIRVKWDICKVLGTLSQGVKVQVQNNSCNLERGDTTPGISQQRTWSLEMMTSSIFSRGICKIWEKKWVKIIKLTLMLKTRSKNNLQIRNCHILRRRNRIGKPLDFQQKQALKCGNVQRKGRLKIRLSEIV